MQAWLMRLSGAFVLAAAGYSAYAFLHGDDGARLTQQAEQLRPTINDLMDQGQVALRTLIQTAQEASASSTARPTGDRRAQAQLPFVVVEPHDRVAPIAISPSQPRDFRTITPPSPPVELANTYRDGGPLDLDPVEARLRAKVPEELFRYFDLYLYVSKAMKGKGEWAQRLFALEKRPDQNLNLLYQWPVSTGLEQPLPAPNGRMLGTNTPGGIFKLDRGRFFKDYHSHQWDSPMPFAMFFDWVHGGRVSGLAIHGTDEEGIRALGQRASHGCIRMSPENAKILFQLIQSKYRGLVPAFRVDPETRTMNTAGLLQRNRNGKVVMTRGYKVLVFIEDFGGPSQDTVAALF
ncbi:MAG: L,D-transpeptidase family protein [Alphaproteobacteria bacterium]|nr:L,D-transpeptidase family protein [Alphaproteobacteria bacterium]